MGRNQAETCGSCFSGIYLESANDTMIKMLEEAATYSNISIQLPANYYFTDTLVNIDIPNEMDAASKGNWKGLVPL